MHRLRTHRSTPGSRPQPGRHAHYAPRIIGFGILIAAVLFIAIGLVTA